MDDMEIYFLQLRAKDSALERNTEACNSGFQNQQCPVLWPILTDTAWRNNHMQKPLVCAPEERKPNRFAQRIIQEAFMSIQ
jgi:hypothetical protein